MQFQHPEVLYALCLLAIPIIVHLFNLQRFTKIPFSNVSFLKNLEKQTRKSSKLKKWLTLFCRLAALACLIIAFAQPYFSNFTKKPKINTSIYLDNSYSMQARGENGRLLNANSQEIINYFLAKENQSISLFTNNKTWKNIPFHSLKKNLIELTYSAKNISIPSAILKVKSLENKNKEAENHIILISDFQTHITKNLQKIDTTKHTHIHWIQTLPKEEINYFIDSLYVQPKDITQLQVTAIIKSSKPSTEKIPVSLSSESQLVGKSTVEFNQNTSEKVVFTIPKQHHLKGKVSINADDIIFDNDFYFTFSTPEKINVLSIGEKAPYFSKIYTDDEFNYSNIPLKKLSYAAITSQQLIILNELTSIPSELTNELAKFTKKGGSLAIIPAKTSTINSYNLFLQKLSLGKITKKITQKHLVTNMNNQSGILKGVFEKKISNFQYPSVASYFSTELQGFANILNFDDHSAFIASRKNVYWIAAPLNKENSNFQKSPLIVPVFYNFAKNSYRLAAPYYTIGTPSEIAITTKLDKNDVVTITNGKTSFIPLQNQQQQHVKILLNQPIEKSGWYEIKKGNQLINTIAFNYHTDESKTIYKKLSDDITFKNTQKISTSIKNTLQKIDDTYKIKSFFKWFLALCILFLLAEMLILRFFKT